MTYSKAFDITIHSYYIVQISIKTFIYVKFGTSTQVSIPIQLLEFVDIFSGGYLQNVSLSLLDTSLFFACFNLYYTRLQSLSRSFNRSIKRLDNCHHLDFQQKTVCLLSKYTPLIKQHLILESRCIRNNKYQGLVIPRTEKWTNENYP